MGLIHMKLQLFFSQIRANTQYLGHDNIGKNKNKIKMGSRGTLLRKISSLQDPSSVCVCVCVRECVCIFHPLFQIRSLYQLLPFHKLKLL